MPRLDGIDIYHGQADAGPVDLVKVAAIPTWWFAAKATQSTTYKDPWYDRFMAQARSLFTHRLAYHWTSSITDPLQQADWFLQSTNGADGVGAMQDIEEAGSTVPRCLAWFERVENHTHRPCIGYAGLYVSGGTIWKSPALRMSAYGPRPFVVAAYVPKLNLDARMIYTGSQAFPYQAWQFSSNGPVPGITGRCDMDEVQDRQMFDLACQTVGNLPAEDELLDVVRDAETNLNKFAVMLDGTLRPLSGVELKARGIVNSVDLGVPLSAADRAVLGSYVPPVTTIPPIVAPPLTGHIYAELGEKGIIQGSVG